MIETEELVRMPEYWMENIQNEIYYELKTYMKEKGLNQTELAEHLGFTKGYISQVLHGNFNHSMQKLIELSLAIGKAPDVNFISIGNYIDKLKISEPNTVSVVLDGSTTKKELVNYYEIENIETKLDCKVIPINNQYINFEPNKIEYSGTND